MKIVPFFSLLLAATLSGALAEDLLEKYSSLNESVQVFREIGATEVVGEIVTVVTYKYTGDEVEKMVSAKRLELEDYYKPKEDDVIEREYIKEQIAQYKADLLNGYTNKRSFSLTVGKNSVLLHTKEVGQVAPIDIWELYTPTALYSYNAFNKTVVVNPAELNRSSSLGVLLYALGTLGQSGIGNREIAKNLDLSKQGELMLQKIGVNSLSFKISSDPKLLDERSISFPRDNYKDRFVYRGFKNNGVGTFPEEIESTLDFGDVVTKTEVMIAKVETLRIGGGDVALPLFGGVSVVDGRFNQPIKFAAIDVIPDDKVVTKFKNDPEFLKKYNLEMRESGKQ